MYEALGEAVQAGRESTDVESRKTVHISKERASRPHMRSNLALDDPRAFEKREDTDEGEDV